MTRCPTCGRDVPVPGSTQVRCPDCGGLVSAPGMAQDPDATIPSRVNPAAAPAGTAPATADASTAPVLEEVDDESTAPLLEVVEDASIAPAPGEVGGDGPTLPQAIPGSVMPARFNISLAIVGGERAGEVLRLERSSCVIGRAGADATADIQIDDPTLSVAHAGIECLGGLVILKDLGSHNGTFVNDKPVTTATLEDRAEFRVGRTVFMLILTDKA